MQMKPRTVVIVEEDLGTLEFIETFLAIEHFNVHGFSDHQSAIEWLKLQNYQPCVIILDCKIRFVAAEDFMREFGYLGIRTHLLLISGARDAHQHAAELGIVHVLPKPFSPDQLLEMINKQDCSLPSDSKCT